MLVIFDSGLLADPQDLMVMPGVHDADCVEDTSAYSELAGFDGWRMKLKSINDKLFYAKYQGRSGLLDLAERLKNSEEVVHLLRSTLSARLIIIGERENLGKKLPVQDLRDAFAF